MNTEKNTILLIDDVEENRVILKLRLEKEGYRIITANNGKEGLEILAQEADTVSSIFLDINMPVMDGHAFLSRIKADPRYTSIPIIVTTALDETSEVLKALREGACGYLTKPFSMEQIRAQLKFCLNHKVQD